MSLKLGSLYHSLSSQPSLLFNQHPSFSQQSRNKRMQWDHPFKIKDTHLTKEDSPCLKIRLPLNSSLPSPSFLLSPSINTLSNHSFTHLRDSLILSNKQSSCSLINLSNIHHHSKICIRLMEDMYLFRPKDSLSLILFHLLNYLKITLS